jgi:hypothetical protein
MNGDIAYRILFEKHEKQPLGKLGRKLEDNIHTGLREIC